MRLVIIDLKSADEALVRSVLSALPQAEQLRITRYRAAADRARSALSQAALRSELARMLGMDAGEIVLRRGTHGKPALPGLPVQFSIAHSGDYAVCALDDQQLGVDVERVGQRDLQRIAVSCFSSRENAQLAASPSPKRAFYRMWTQKESTVKALGTGLADLRDVEIEADTPLLRGRALPYRLHAFELRAGDAQLSAYGALPDTEALYALCVCQSERASQRIDTHFTPAREAALTFLESLSQKA